jgi:hypothetical protein
MAGNQRYPDSLVAQWSARLSAGATASKIAAELDGVSRNSVLGAVHRYRIKINGPPKGPPQRRKRTEGIRTIMSDNERRKLYGKLKYDNITREFLDNTPVVRAVVFRETVSALQDA